MILYVILNRSWTVFIFMSLVATHSTSSTQRIRRGLADSQQPSNRDFGQRQPSCQSHTHWVSRSKWFFMMRDLRLVKHLATEHFLSCPDSWSVSWSTHGAAQCEAAGITVCVSSYRHGPVRHRPASPAAWWSHRSWPAPLRWWRERGWPAESSR